MDMETRGRSRSKTPFTGVEEYAKEFIEKGSYSQNTVIHSTRSTTYRTVESSVKSNDEVTTVNDDKLIRKSTRSLRNVEKLYRTSDYSSEDGETEVSSTKSRFQNDKNQLIEDARAAANGNSEISALDLYKKSGRYWDIYPKTDWTYSPHSKDRVELAPGVVAMPNMSRKPIHSADSSRVDFAHKETNTETMMRQQMSSNAFAEYQPRQLFNNNHEYQEAHKKVGYTRSTRWQRISRTLSTMVATLVAVSHFLFRVQTSWFAKVHQFTGRVMLLDTWLLWKSGRDKTAKLAALCLVPLLLLGGWYIVTNLSGILHATHPSPPPPPPPLVAISEPPPRPITIEPPNDRGPPDPQHCRPYLVSSVLGSAGFRDITRRADRLSTEVRHLEARLAKLDRTRLEEAQLRRQRDLRLSRCCARPAPDVEGLVARLLNDEGFLGRQLGLDELLRARFAAIRGPTEEVVVGTVSEEAIERAVRRVLRVYDADKTGLVDYAMESMGGQVVSTRCTETYRYGKAVVSLLGVPLWYAVNSPRTVITPGAIPGECWAFQGFPGFLVVRLSKRVHVEAVSLEHISRLLAPDGDIGSAPRRFQVLGLRDEEDKEPVQLGEFEYDVDGEPLQIFEVRREAGGAFEVVELRVLSNHGNPNYTCLYRLRVHGRSGT